MDNWWLSVPGFILGSIVGKIAGILTADWIVGMLERRDRRKTNTS